MRTLRRSVVVIVAAAAILVWTAGRAGALGFLLGESKEELKLKYDLAVTEFPLDADGRPGAVLVTVELTLADEGRPKPLDEVQLVVPSREKYKDGGYGADLVVSIDMRTTNDGKRVGRVQFLKELAEHAQIMLNTYTLDGKNDQSTRLHHVIPLAKFLKNPPAAKPAAPSAPAAKPSAPAKPAAAEGKRD